VSRQANTLTGENKMKPSIEPLKVRFVVSVVLEKQQNMFTGRYKNVKVPSGEAHIFRTKKITEKKRGGKDVVRYELFDTSMCGKARGDIGHTTAEYENLPIHAVCQKCEMTWKNHPLSLWKSFTQGTAIKAG
jgi:hypothetical protein